MCKGGGGNTTTTTSSPPASVLQQYQTVQNQANSVASNPYYFYPGQQVAGMTGNQTDAISNTANLAGGLANTANTYGMAQPFMNAGSSMTGQAANTIGGVGNSLAALENPNNTYGQAMPFINQASGLISSATQPIGSQQINNYMNPYLQQVGATTSAEMNQNNAIQQQGLLGNAAASGALGGNRVGLAQSALANQQNMAENATLANINSQGFNTALGAAQTTAGQQLQGGFLAGQTGQMAENAALTGLTAPIGAAQSIAGTQLAAGSQYGNLGAANESAALSGMQAGLTGAAAQYGMGTAQQQQQQNQLTAAQGQWTGSVQYPFQNTNFLSGISTGLGSLSGGTSSTTAPGPNTASQIVGGLTSAAGLAGSLMSLKTGGRVGYAGGGIIGAPAMNAMMVPDEVGAIMGMAHGPGVPQAPQIVSPTANSSNAVSGMSGLSSALGGLGKAIKTSPIMKEISGVASAANTGYFAKRGGKIPGFAYGGAAVPTPMSEQILDYQMMGQLMPGSQIQKTKYQAPAGLYAAGGAIGPTKPEAAADVHAQIAALVDPKSARRAVFVAKGTPLPKSIPHGVEAAQRPEGTLFSADSRLLQQFHDAPLITDDGMAEALGYLHGKSAAGPHAAVVRAHDGHGVSYESAVHPDAVQAALMLARMHAPSARLDVVDPRQALQDRAERRGYATGGSPQGMQGVSSLPLVGAQAGLSAPEAGQLLLGGYSAGPSPHATSLSIPTGPPSTMPVVGAPQVGGLSIPNISNSNQFASINLPGGGSTGPITDPSGVPSNYFSTIEHASPYFNPNSSATAPSSGLSPYMPHAGNTASTAHIPGKIVPMYDGINIGAFGAKSGGRIGKDVGGLALADPSDAAPISVKTMPPISAPSPTLVAPPVQKMAGIAAVPLSAPQSGNASPAPGFAAQHAQQPAPSQSQGAPAPSAADPNAFYSTFADRVSNSESGNNPTAVNSRSTATGADQFTNETWLNVIKTAEPGLAAHSSPAQLLALRNNPTISKAVTIAYAKQNASQLTANNIAPTHTNLDLAHRFGATGATRILHAPASTPAVDVIGPLAIKENPEYANMNTGQLVAQSARFMNADSGTAPEAPSAPVSAPGFSASPQSTPQASQQGSIASPQIGPPSMASVQQSVGPVPKIPQAHETTIEKLANSPWMALADAGFNMMAGTSPFFGVNVGRGMAAGTQYLNGEQQQQRAIQTLRANTGVSQANADLRNRELVNQRYGQEASAGNTLGSIESNYALGLPGATATQQQVNAGQVVAPNLVGQPNGLSVPFPNAGAPHPTVATPMNTTASTVPPPGQGGTSARINQLSQEAQVPGIAGAAARAQLAPILTNVQGQATQESQQWATLQGQIPTVEKSMSLLEDLSTAAQTAPPNAFQSFVANQGSKLEALGSLFGVKGPITNYVAASQLISKIHTQLATQATQIAGQTANEALNTIGNSVPSGNLASPKSFDQILRSVAQQSQYLVDMQNYGAQNRLGSLARHPYNPQDWKQKFYATHPPAMYASRVQPLAVPVAQNGTVNMGALKPGFNYQGPNGVVGQWNGQTLVPVNNLGNAQGSD